MVVVIIPTINQWTIRPSAAKKSELPFEIDSLNYGQYDADVLQVSTH